MVEGVFGRFGSIEELNSIPKGYARDKININNSHLTRAKVIIPVLLNMLNQ